MSSLPKFPVPSLVDEKPPAAHYMHLYKANSFNHESCYNGFVTSWPKLYGRLHLRNTMSSDTEWINTYFCPLMKVERATVFIHATDPKDGKYLLKVVIAEGDFDKVEDAKKGFFYSGESEQIEAQSCVYVCNEKENHIFKAGLVSFVMFVCYTGGYLKDGNPAVSGKEYSERIGTVIADTLSKARTFLESMPSLEEIEKEAGSNIMFIQEMRNLPVKRMREPVTDSQEAQCVANGTASSAAPASVTDPRRAQHVANGTSSSVVPASVSKKAKHVATTLVVNNTDPTKTNPTSQGTGATAKMVQLVPTDKTEVKPQVSTTQEKDRKREEFLLTMGWTGKAYDEESKTVNAKFPNFNSDLKKIVIERRIAQQQMFLNMSELSLMNPTYTEEYLRGLKMNSDAQQALLVHTEALLREKVDEETVKKILDFRFQYFSEGTKSAFDRLYEIVLKDRGFDVKSTNPAAVAAPRKTTKPAAALSKTEAVASPTETKTTAGTPRKTKAGASPTETKTTAGTPRKTKAGDSLTKTTRPAGTRCKRPSKKVLKANAMLNIIDEYWGKNMLTLPFEIRIELFGACQWLRKNKKKWQKDTPKHNAIVDMDPKILKLRVVPEESNKSRTVNKTPTSVSHASDDKTQEESSEEDEEESEEEVESGVDKGDQGENEEEDQGEDEEEGEEEDEEEGEEEDEEEDEEDSDSGSDSGAHGVTVERAHKSS